ncbi:amidase family protein [Halomonas sp. DN3]|uniref:amidase family protein n=1 Tax=Halomonas sp. DN3 TaxID=2953657 RepID=UPI00209FF486|nr:amidase family protein [Halomonas sp. DN3]USZ50350.1 amidase family protein [Halomonas sp. DN3]
MIEGVPPRPQPPREQSRGGCCVQQHFASLHAASALTAKPARHRACLRYTCPFDLSGHPTITLPAGFSQQGGPIAFQFIAPMFDEAMLVRAGWAFQQVTDWHRRHPEL